MTRHTVLLADDHALVRAGLRSLLERIPGVEVVGEASNGLEALDAIARLQPEIVLMDLSMPELNGLEALRRAAKLARCPRILVLSMHSDREYVRTALAAGAAGYLLKSADRGELALALATVARGALWLSPSLNRGVVDESRTSSTPQLTEALTPRQREVLQLIADGHATRQIARRLRISVKTVESHRAQIMERLGIHNVPGLVRYAVRTGIVVDG